MACTVSQESEKDFIIICENIPIRIYTRFSSHPDQLCGPPSLLYNGYWVFLGGKVWPPSSAEVLEDKSYTYTPLWATTRPVTGLLYLYLLTVYITMCTHIVYCLSFLNTHHFLRNPHASTDLKWHLVVFNIHLIHLTRYWCPNLETVNS
jgi:hypothetical protein